jgi:hypothetical protein
MFKNHNTLELLAKHAYSASASKKPSDIIVAMMKLAASDEIYDEIFSLPEKRIKSILSEPGKYEYKKNDIRKVLQDSLGATSSYAISKAKNDEIASAVGEFMPVNFIDYSADRLEKYNGAEAQNFSLKGLVNGALNAASQLVTQRALKQKQVEQSKPAPTSLDVELKGGKGEGNRNTFQDMIADTSSENAFEKIYQEGSNGDADDKERALELLIGKILRDPSQDILSVYVENKILPEFNVLKQRLSGDNFDPAASADMDAFYDKFFKYVADNIGKQKRIYDQKGGRREYTLQQVQEVVNEQLEKLDLDNLLEYIYKQNFYELPKWARKADQTLVKKILKSLIKSTLIFNAKSSMDVSMPSGKTKMGRGSSKLSNIDMVWHILKKEIRDMAKDEDEQNQLIDNALKILGSKVDKETKEVVHKPKDALQYSLFQHVTPVMKAALFQKAAEMYGEKFSELSPEEQASVVNEVQSKVYTGAKMPYTYDTGGYELKTTPYHTLENAEATTRQSIQDSLQNAMDIKSGKSTPGGFMKKRNLIQSEMPSDYNFNSDIDDLDNEGGLGKESALSYMIKKYAFKN